MATYAMLTRLSSEALTGPDAVAELNRRVQRRVKQDCRGVKWLANYAVLGPCDYLDIFESPDAETATKVALLVRALGHATTETWVLTPWDRYVEMIQRMRKK
jgi:uncharacterized protein with GYD domain